MASKVPLAVECRDGGGLAGCGSSDGYLRNKASVFSVLPCPKAAKEMSIAFMDHVKQDLVFFSEAVLLCISRSLMALFKY